MRTIRRSMILPGLLFGSVALAACGDALGPGGQQGGEPGLYAVQPLWGFDAPADRSLRGYTTDTFGQRLSPLGIAVGRTSDIPVRWIHGIPEEIPLGDGSPGYVHSGPMVHGINGSGDMVGQVGGNAGPVQAWVMRDGVARTLPTLGESATAIAVNDRGDIAGFSSAPTRYPQAVLWRDDVLIQIGTLGGSHSRALAIDDQSRVVGWSWPAAYDARKGFLWEDGEMTALGGLHEDRPPEIPFETVPNDINRHRQIVGWTGRNEAIEPFLWEKGKIRSLGGGVGAARAINSDGVVVGTAVIRGQWLAVLWSEGIRYDLNEYLQDRMIVLLEALDINDAGQILATGFVRDQNGSRAVLLTPIEGE